MSVSLGSGHKDTRRYRRKGFSDINVTPLVDVMLVLLIIFMITAPMLTAGVSVDLPESAASALPGQDEPINVSIKGGGKIYINDNPIALEALRSKLAAIASEKKDVRIFVRGDRSVDYGSIMRVVGEIGGAGYTKVALVTTETTPRAARKER